MIPAALRPLSHPLVPDPVMTQTVKRAPERVFPRIRAQVTDDWCWAEAAAFVCRAYGADASLDQERVIRAYHEAAGLPLPCEDLPDCVNEYSLELVLQALDLLELEEAVSPGALPAVVDRVRAELAAERPVCLRLSSKGVGHFICLAAAFVTPGPEGEGVHFEVHDPWLGQVIWIPSHELFREGASYQGRGEPENVYWTRPPGNPWWSPPTVGPEVDP